jgi:hypothetical protein
LSYYGWAYVAKSSYAHLAQAAYLVLDANQTTASSAAARSSSKRTY